MDHKKLNAWLKSVDFTEEIYKLTLRFPKHEINGLVSQLRRAAVSIPTNIAEGSSRNHNKEVIQFLYFSLGSASEIETLLLICKKVNYIDEAEQNHLLSHLTSIKVTIIGLIKYLKNKPQ